jgi:hypothetical protein
MKKFMCLDELNDLCSRAGFLDENFVDRDINMVSPYWLKKGIQSLNGFGSG